MPDPWCRRCDKWPSLPNRKFCEECSRKQQPLLALGCLSLVFGLGAAVGFFARGFL